MAETVSDTPEECEWINKAIQHELNVQIIWSAMKILQKNPEFSISMAMEDAFGEWDK